MKNFSIIIINVIFLSMTVSMNSCLIKSGGKVDAKFKSRVSIKNDQIELRFDKNMYCKVFFKNLSLNIVGSVSGNTFPTHFIKINDSVLKDFTLINDSVKQQNINTEFGSGKRLILNGNAETLSGITVRKKLMVELYDKYPTTAIMYAEYQNLSDIKIELQELVSDYFKLNASLVNERDFHMFLGVAGRPSMQLYTPIPDEFERDNYIGRSEKFEKVKAGFGGIPVTDIWCAKMGIGIGHIEPVWQNLSMPVKVDEDKNTIISIRENPGMNLPEPFMLEPHQKCKTVKTFINLHTLDFYNTAEIYGQLMHDQNISFKTDYVKSDYAVSWCSWNDFSSGGMASKHDYMIKNAVLGRVKELNPNFFQQIIFDAGWFNNQGDWLPNTDKPAFPGGVNELISTIKTIHDDGFKVMLWISFLTADPWSEVAKQHPDWMITKPNGDFHYDRWSGYTMCPSLPEVQEFHMLMARRLIKMYGADGFKVDGMYTCPPCYNPKHHHKNPNESSADFYKVFEAFYNEAKKVNSEATVMVCPCGTIDSYAILPYVSQTIGADPERMITVRQMSKLYKALKGNSSPYISDDINYAGDENLRLPTAIGVGAVPQFLYGNPPDTTKKKFYDHWLKICHQEQIFNSEYVNLYDMYYDKPETYVFKKLSGNKEIQYYSFFADTATFKGEIELRGLKQDLNYKVVDYDNDKILENVSGKKPVLMTSFRDYLFIKCIPE
jgi:alpha-galactosidase